MTDVDIESIAQHLAEIYRRVVELRRQNPDAAEFEVWELSDVVDKLPPSRIASVETAQDGLAYAAWCVGQTMGII